MAEPLKVLLVGASGVFGSRLAELAAGEPGLALTLAARGAAKLEALAARLPGEQSCMVLDRDHVTAHDLKGFDLVVDAAGPFQASQMRLVESALAAGVHYLDLADGREWVRDFARLDEVAKGAEVSLITGASSIPALSHAVVDHLTHNWTAIEHLRIGIYPGNRAPRGLAVVEAILSYVGKPVRVLREGDWQDVSGWGMTHREDVPGVGKRWASVCDTPEQDLLVERYAPSEGAEFFAGLELSLLHLGLAAFAQPVRWGWVKGLRPISRAMLTIAKLFLPLGSDRGAMTVAARGRDAQGKPVTRQFVLKADANRGPYVPTLAALAMIRRMRDDGAPEAGARACSGILTLADFEHDFARLGITYTLYDVSESASVEIEPMQLRDGRVSRFVPSHETL